MIPFNYKDTDAPRPFGSARRRSAGGYRTRHAAPKPDRPSMRVPPYRLRHAAPRGAERRRTPTWCDIVSALAAAGGTLVGAIQLFRN